MTVRIRPTFEQEKALWARGLAFIAGVDEAGAGTWAGPVYAAAVILRPDWDFELIRDSKMLSAAQRDRAVVEIKSAAVAWAVGVATAEEIDALNIRRAAALAMRRAVEALSPQPQHLLIDAFRIPGLDLPQTNLIRGDALVKSIAAASIVAKTERDALMLKLALDFPGYGFENHKGYGTKEHQLALRRFGPCPIHRRTYEPVRQALALGTRQ